MAFSISRESALPLYHHLREGVRRARRKGQNDSYHMNSVSIAVVWAQSLPATRRLIIEGSMKVKDVWRCRLAQSTRGVYR